MKILWVVGIYVGKLADELNIKISSGQWINAEIEKEKTSERNEIIICTSGVRTITLSDNNIQYEVLPHGNVSKYQINTKNIKDWKKIINKYNPDLILVWGTEYNISKCCLLANERKIPSIIYIQGVMQSIYENYRGCLTDSQIKKMTTLIEKIRNKTIFDIEKQLSKDVEREQEIINLSGRVIVENDWAKNIYKNMNTNVKVYKNRLPIKSCFANYTWSKNIVKHQILTTSMGYPLKGLHFLLEALAIVIKEIPTVTLLIPGYNNVITSGIKEQLKQSGYGKFLKKIIEKYDLNQHVKFVGVQSAEQYAKLMQNSEIFISASAIENHGSAIREAMTIGTPCICSNVGGLSSFLINNENCLLYDFSNIQELSNSIIDLINNKELQYKLSNNSKKTIFEMYSKDPLSTLDEIYNNII